MKKKPDYGFAGVTIGIMIKMLREEFTDEQIKKMLTRKKITAAMEILDEQPSKQV